MKRKLKNVVAVANDSCNVEYIFHLAFLWTPNWVNKNLGFCFILEDGNIIEQLCSLKNLFERSQKSITPFLYYTHYPYRSLTSKRTILEDSESALLTSFKSWRSITNQLSEVLKKHAPIIGLFFAKRWQKNECLTSSHVKPYVIFLFRCSTYIVLL